MIVPHVTFIRPIPILGTGNRQDQFSAADGWRIEVHDYGVTLSREERQNVPAVAAFCTCGVGYSVPAPAKELEPETVKALADAAPAEQRALTYAEVAARPGPAKGKR